MFFYATSNPSNPGETTQRASMRQRPPVGGACPKSFTGAKAKTGAVSSKRPQIFHLQFDLVQPRPLNRTNAQMRTMVLEY